MIRLNLDHNTEKLKRLIAEYPDLPMVILANEESVIDNGAWTYCSDVRFEIAEILDCDDYCDYDNAVVTDRSRLEEIIEDYLYEEYHEKSEQEYDKAIKNKMLELEPYWKKVIVIYATN